MGLGAGGIKVSERMSTVSKSALLDVERDGTGETVE